MKITKLEIKNFLTISEASISLADKGLVLIQGVNLDDPSAKSNGAGKSSIPDALCWALYGTTARGITGDAVVNKIAKKNCHVAVYIEDGDEQYKIMRFRKDKTDKNALLVYKGKPGSSIDLSKGTDRETQEVVTAIIGSTEDVFRSSVYAGQESMPDLPGMTDKFLKLLIEEAAGVETLSKAYEIARTEATTKARALETLQSRKASVLMAKFDEDIKLEEAEVGHREFESGRKGKHAAHAAEAKRHAAAALFVASKKDPTVETGLRNELSELDKKLIRRRAEDERLNTLRTIVTAADREFTKARVNATNEGKQFDKLKAELASVDEKVGKPCGECGKPYSEHDIEDARKIAAEKVDWHKQAVRDAVTDAKDTGAALEKANADLSKFMASMTDFTVIFARQREIREEVEAMGRIDREVEAAKVEVKREVELAKAVLTADNPYTLLVESHKTSIKSKEDQIKRFDGEIADCLVEVENMDNAVKVFGPAGVRARILDTVTPFLNDRTADYLGALSDGNISAVWSTLNRTKAGELKEKFAIEVTNDKGAETFAGLSGGEKRKVRLATTLALQDLVASRATKPIGLFIGDEIDDALDSAGLERLMTILEQKARDRGTVLVISHNDLGDWIDNIATVTKSGGVSLVEGALS